MLPAIYIIWFPVYLGYTGNQKRVDKKYYLFYNLKYLTIK